MDIQLQNQLKRLVEVTALVGLSLHAHREAKVVSELEKYAFPNELAEKINKEIKKWFVIGVKETYTAAR